MPRRHFIVFSAAGAAAVYISGMAKLQIRAFDAAFWHDFSCFISRFRTDKVLLCLLRNKQ